MISRYFFSVANNLGDSVAFNLESDMIASLLFGIAEIELQHAKERQAIGIALARKRGVYTGRRPGTTKAAPSRARTLKNQGLTVLEIAHALGVKERTVYH